jgi:hypothetical protein
MSAKEPVNIDSPSEPADSAAESKTVESESAESKPIAIERLFRDYFLDGAFDEMRTPDGGIRPHYQALVEALASLPHEELLRRKQSADLSFLTQGITFTVYGRDEGTERIFPYDLLPRIIAADEWDRIERGLTQRITALNHFLRDIYGEGQDPQRQSRPARHRLQLQALPPPDVRPASPA